MNCYFKRIYSLCSILVLGGIVTVSLASVGIGVVSYLERDDSFTLKKALEVFKKEIGSFDFNIKVDLAIAGSPGSFMEVNGTSDSEMIMKNQLVLRRSVADGKESVAIEGFRTDTNKFFNITFDGNRTPISYLEGNHVENTRRLKDSVSGTTVVTVYEENGNSVSNVKVLPQQVQFLEIKSKRSSRTVKNILKEFMKRPVKPPRINRSKDNPDPAERYTEEHDNLHKFAGDFKSNNGSIDHKSRVICEGRFLVTKSIVRQGEKEFEVLSFTGVDSTRNVFQGMTFLEGLTIPQYTEGKRQDDGSLIFSNPFNPNEYQLRIVMNDDGSYTETRTQGENISSTTFSRSKR